MYQPKVGTLRPPDTNTSECWLAFVDRSEHAVPGWTKVPLLLFGTYERNENFVKVMLPAVFAQRAVFLNHALPEARCFKLSHITRAPELARGASKQPHVLASKIPSWSGRSILSNQLDITREFAAKRNRTADLADLAKLQTRMESAGFNSSAPNLPRILDTLWMVWPLVDEVVQRFSRLWIHEVARYSSFEKASYPWVFSRVPEFKPWLTDAIYIYSPEQRCGWSSNKEKGNASRRTKKRLRGRYRRLHSKIEEAA